MLLTEIEALSLSLGRERSGRSRRSRARLYPRGALRHLPPRQPVVVARLRTVEPLDYISLFQLDELRATALAATTAIVGFRAIRGDQWRHLGTRKARHKAKSTDFGTGG